MSVVGQILFLLLWLFRVLLLGRIVLEFVRMFARRWRPSGAGAVTVEIFYVTTDPPVKLFRRLIPPVRLGGVGFDLSVIVLAILVTIAMSLVLNLMVL